MKGTGFNMKFRPCIDIHNGSVKQIVGSSLKDNGSQAEDNFVSLKDAAYYAEMYKRDGFTGGHVIILNPPGSQYYNADIAQAGKALGTFRNGMQAGGGVNIDNAKMYLDMGASHVIVTSYVFRDGIIDYGRLKQLSTVTGRNKLVLDLSCRYIRDNYYIVTGTGVEKMIGYTNIDTEKGFAFFQRYLREKGIIEALEQKGIKEGDTVKIYGLEFDYYK